MNEFEKPKGSPAAGSELESLEGKRVCASCGKITGDFNGEGTTHGICPECKIKTVNGDPELVSKARDDQKSATDNWAEMKKGIASEVINIIENGNFLHQNKIQHLMEKKGFIRTQTKEELSDQSAPEQLLLIAQKLKEIF